MKIDKYVNIMSDDVRQFNIEVNIVNENSNCDMQFILALAYKLINSTTKVEFLFYLDDVENSNKKEVHDIMLALSFNLNNFNVKINYEHIQLLDIAIKKLNEIIEIYTKIYSIHLGTLKNDVSSKYIVSLVNNRLEEVDVLGRQLYYLENREFTITDRNREYLVKLLRYVSPYDSFKEGQLESLEKIINSKSNVACLMPTGSGKSLIFFMLNYLRLGTTLVVSPTDVLIEDQIYQLYDTHKIDDVSYLKFPCKTNFDRYKVVNSFVYIEPIMLLSKFLKRNFMNQQFAYIIFDEVHCMSSIGHDFRPEYLMVATNLQKIKNVQSIGFTATVNYSIAKDIKEDLNIKNENFFSPISMKKENISFNYLGVNDLIESIDKVVELGSELIKQNKRALIFAKNDEYTSEITARLGEKAVSFKKDDKTSYREFVKGKHNILVSNEFIGIGINFPNITEIIHMGFPVSMSDYIQEIGRGGRNGELVLSSIVYIKRSSNEFSDDTIKRSISMHDLLENNKEDNDIIDGYKMIRKFISSPEDYISGFSEMVERINIERMFDISKYNFNSYLHYCYSAFVLGYISNWGIDSNVDGQDYHITIEQNSEIGSILSAYELQNNMTQKGLDFFTKHDPDVNSIWRKNTSLHERIKIYANWFFDKYLHNKKEIFLDMIDFIWYFAGKDNAILRDLLAQNASLDMEAIEMFAHLVYNSTIESINNEGYGMSSYDKISSLEKALADKYSYKADYVIVLSEMRNRGTLNKQRLERIIASCNKKEHEKIFNGLSTYYTFLNNNEKIILIKCIVSYGQELNKTLNNIYKTNPRDELYYQLLSLKLNRKVKEYGKRIK